MASKQVRMSGLWPLVVDVGNAWLKALHGTEVMFVHKLAELTPAEFKSALKRFGDKAPLDLIEMSGKYYAIGDTAESYNVQVRQRRTKYVEGYYDVLVAGAIARIFMNDDNSYQLLTSTGLDIMASHASRDSEFSGLVVNALKKRWDFTCNGKRFRFTVNRVMTYEEPWGGYLNRALVEVNKRWTSPLAGKAVGVLDAGGGTCGCMMVDEEGHVLFDRSHSGTQGVNTALQRLRGELEVKYPDFFSRGTPSEPRLRDALRTGFYRGGGGDPMDCKEAVERSLAPLLNELGAMWATQLDGGVNLDALVLTGGGMGLLNGEMSKLTNFKNIVLADEVDHIQFANVFGAAKYIKVTEEV